MSGERPRIRTGARPEGFEVRSSETIYTGTIFTLRRDVVSFPDGSSASRDVVAHGGAAAIVPLDDDGNVVLIEQYRHSVQQVLWECPAGLLDATDPSPLAAAQRELAEEVGLAADRWHTLVDMVSAPGFCNERVRVFLARGLHEVARPDGFVLEHEEAAVRVHRVPLAEAVAAVHAGEVVNSLAVGALLAAERATRDESVLRPADAPLPG